ncbi:uncharacterized protein [Primulina eburnea]|uniref:uncharacterized protein n=1 Tax=Primulina eburnea TaxID=1245227 RepID=UPI003C6CC413
MDVDWSLTFLADYRKAKESGNLCTKNARGKPEKSWTPPRASTLKLNIDAAVNNQLSHYCVGGVVRDKQGRLLMAFGKQINQPISVVHGELLVASDSLLAVQAVTIDLENHSYTGACAAEIIPMLKQPVVSEIVHVRREANRVAHTIAHFAFSSPSSFVWVNGEFPSWLSRLVMDDL